MASAGRCGRTIALSVLALVIFSIVLAGVPASVSVPAAEDADEGDRLRLPAVQLAGPFQYPWSIAFLPDHSILVTEKVGRLQLIRLEGDPVSVARVPAVLHKGHGGLLDVAVDPAFPKNGILYLSYLHGSEELSSVRVLSARLDRSSNALVDQRVIFESIASTSAEQLGGRIAITRDGHLFLTLGARWQAKRAQDLSDDAGKIIRIRTDGSVPEDNPFVAVSGARPEIWSYGHRNPQGLAFDAAGRLWSHEHGPLGGDELNLIHSGRNYGWPVITYGLTYSGDRIGEGTEKEGMEQPIRYWSPAIAPSGLAVQVAGATTLIWIGALADQSLVMLELVDDRIIRERRWLQKELGRIRDVRVGLDSSLYIIVDDAQGGLYRLNTRMEQAR
jgi:glucose/arabinose dehydrogenase